MIERGNPYQHSFPASGWYNVKMRVRDKWMQTIELVKSLLVVLEPMFASDFTYTPSAPIENESITFNPVMNGHPNLTYTYLWTFHDGSTSTQANPSKAYPAYGNFPVSMVSTDQWGRSAPPAEDIVAVRSAVLPSVTFVEQENQATPLLVDFTPTTQGVIDYLHWDYGNGVTEDLPNGVASYIYQQPGEYSVICIPFDIWGRSGTPYSRGIEVQGEVPVASPAINGASHLEDSIISFDGSGSEGYQLTYSWVWGDGTATGTGVNPTHVYQDAGTYNGSLTVTDRWGRTGTAPFQIVISSRLTLSSSGRLVHEEFFGASGSLPASWETSTQYSLDNNRAKKVVGGPQSTTNVALNGRQHGVLQQTLNTGSHWGNQIGFIVKNDGAGNSYLVYLISASNGTSRSISFAKYTGNAFAVVSSATYNFNLNTNYDFKVEFKAGSQKVWINGTLVISATDTSNNAVAGKWGIYGYLVTANSVAYFDDFLAAASNAISCTGLPAGHKLALGSLIATESGGIATIELGNLKLPSTTVKVLNASNQEIATLTPPLGVWGGDIYTYTP